MSTSGNSSVFGAWLLGLSSFALGNPAIGQVQSSSGDCSPNMALMIVKGDVIISCNRYRNELQPIQKALQKLQQDYRLGEAKLDIFILTINSLIAPSIQKAETDYKEDREARISLERSMARLITVIQENHTAIAEQPVKIAELSQTASRLKSAAITKFLSGEPTHFVSSPHHQTIALVEFDLTYSKSKSSKLKLTNLRFRVNPDVSDYGKEHIDDIRTGKSFSMHLYVEHRTKIARSKEEQICCWRDVELTDSLKGADFVGNSDASMEVDLPFEINFKDLISDHLRVWVYMRPEGRVSGSGGSISLLDAIEY